MGNKLITEKFNNSTKNNQERAHLLWRSQKFPRVSVSNIAKIGNLDFKVLWPDIITYITGPPNNECSKNIKGHQQYMSYLVCKDPDS